MKRPDLSRIECPADAEKPQPRPMESIAAPRIARKTVSGPKERQKSDYIDRTGALKYPEPH
jgi:hypothetical protein